LREAADFSYIEWHMPRRVRLAAIAALMIAFLSGPGPREALHALPAAQGPKPFDVADRAFILCWHSFLGKSELNTDFSLAELEGQLDELAALGYRFIDLDDALFGRIEGGLNLVATIDDGHRTIAPAFAKVFASRGIRPALVVYPAVIDASPYFMKSGEIRSLVSSGCSVGAHGFYHLFVTEKLYRSDKAAFEKEIFRAKADVEAISGLPAYFYAYPFGILDPITKTEVERAGYEFGLAVKPGFIYADQRLVDRYEIPRTVVLRKGWKTLLAFLARNAGTAKVIGPEPQTWTESDEFPAPELWTGQRDIR
jgi:peptidoglycan/xylan/chitin deacetylase (PgdA/CDA1 family)